MLLEILVIVLCLCLAGWGYKIYGVHVLKKQIENFLVFPWLGFSFLAFLDWTNIFLSEKATWLGIIGGGVMFFGPLFISFAILKKGYKIYGKNHEVSAFITSRIALEYSESKTEAILMVFGGIILIVLFSTEYLFSWGKSYGVELSIAGFTVLLDVVAAYGLAVEIKKTPSKFERTSWKLWAIAAIIFWLIIIRHNAWWSIEALLILESAIVSGSLLFVIMYYSRK